MTQNIKDVPVTVAVIKQPTHTSIHNGGVAVEDQPALVQGRGSVQEVEGPQVPLTPAVKADNSTQHRRYRYKLTGSLHLFMLLNLQRYMLNRFIMYIWI